MEYCSKCGEMMEFHISYFCGTPLIYYTCPCCGNDTRKYICTATTAVSQVNKPKQMNIKLAEDIVKEMEERGAITVPQGCVTGEAFEEWLWDEVVN